MIRWQHEHEDAQFDKQGNCHLLVNAKRTQQPRGCRVRFCPGVRPPLCSALITRVSASSCCRVRRSRHQPRHVLVKVSTTPVMVKSAGWNVRWRIAYISKLGADP